MLSKWGARDDWAFLEAPIYGVTCLSIKELPVAQKTKKPPYFSTLPNWCCFKCTLWIKLTLTRVFFIFFFLPPGPRACAHREAGALMCSLWLLPPAAPTCRSAPCSLQSMYFSHAYDSSVCCGQAITSGKSGLTRFAVGFLPNPPPGGRESAGQHGTRPQLSSRVSHSRLVTRAAALPLLNCASAKKKDIKRQELAKRKRTISWQSNSGCCTLSR